MNDSKDAAAGRAQTNELGYVAQAEGGLRGRLMRGIERLSGLERLRPQYEIWRRDVAGRDPRMFNIALDMLDVSLRVDAPHWPPVLAPDAPVVMIANHPFGIGDGIAALALAEQLDRPFRILLNKEFLRVPEVQPFALPIDFEETRQALQTNLRTRQQARALMKDGVTIVVFPAGGVATARWPWGRARELPWKGFVARLVQESRASVMPIWFEGQNSAFFHAMSHVAPSLRMSLLVAEFRRFIGRQAQVRAGAVMPFDSFKGGDDRRALLDELYLLVHRLAPQLRDLPDAQLLASGGPPREWDRPVAQRRQT